MMRTFVVSTDGMQISGLDRMVGELPAELLDEAIAKIWRDRGAGRGVFLIGHSIGGAITIAIAARRPAWPLRGIAVSGVGLHTPRDLEIRTAALPDIPMITRPSPMKDVVMFGPPWTHDDAMPQASHIADAPVPRRELIDITSWWNKNVRALAATVTVPAVDAGVFASSGHCIDFHRLSGAFQLDQLAFALRCAIDPAHYRH